MGSFVFTVVADSFMKGGHTNGNYCSNRSRNNSGFFVGVVSGRAVLKDELKRVDQKETEKLEDSPKYGFAAKL